MPGRLHNAPTSDPPAARDQTDMAMSSLRFNEPLTWRAGRAIPVAELLKSLESLSSELKDLDQDEIDPTELTPIAQALAGAHLLAHKDKGVRAWTAACIVDVLRLCAPNAPFKGSQLKDIFTTFITSIIPALADPSNAYNQEHIYVLHSLAEYKSIILLTDIEAADSLILSLFTTCFDIVSNSSKASTGEEIVKNVEYDMSRLLVTVIDEAAMLQPEVVDIIIAQFLRVDPRSASQVGLKGKKSAPLDGKQNTLSLKEYPPAYNMAKAICGACPEKMTNHISTYFNNIIIDASDASKVAVTNGHSKQHHKRPAMEDSDDDTENVQQLRKAHKLIRELWRACPDVLHNVVPQLETELSAESTSLRRLATETIGDIAAGIGVAGPPPSVQEDPALWPPMHLGQRENPATTNILTTPMSPKPFPQAHAVAYDSFLSRRQDRSPSIRAAWATAIGRILLTSGGGLGLDTDQERKLMTGLAQMLSDADEKVRMAAVEAVGQFGFTDMVNKFGLYGGIGKSGSVLANLAERLKDRKPNVRGAAFEILGRTWGVAACELEQGSAGVVDALGQIPQQVLNAYLTGDKEIHLSIDKTIFESMVPLSFPPIKARETRTKNRSNKNHGEEEDNVDPDSVRLQRILTFYRDLDEHGRRVFLTIMQRQAKVTQIMTAYLKSCEDFNGGVVENEETTVKSRLSTIVDLASKLFPEPRTVTADLWKFAKAHDRRNYQLIRFTMAPESDYRTVVKAIKELTKRIKSGGSSSLMETLTPLLYCCSLLFLNRSHIPAVIEVSRTNENGLGSAAHDLLRMISGICPAVLKTHILEMCKDLEAEAPSISEQENPSATDTLKACAGFARKFPGEIPKDRKLQVAMTSYALYSSSPRAAKHAVTIIMMTAEKKQMYAKDLVHRAVKDFSLESPHALARLATIAQVNLLAPTAADAENDSVADIALNKVLFAEPSTTSSSHAYTGSDELSETVVAKQWALKVLINRLRSFTEEPTDDVVQTTSFGDMAAPIYRILNLLITNEGELHKTPKTSASERLRLRLIAAKYLMKLCAHRRACEEFVTPENFNALAHVVQDRIPAVRKSFAEQLKRYLNANRLSPRWYTLLFLLAFEPGESLRTGTKLWLKGQSQALYRSSHTNPSLKNAMELVFARLLSALAHHPDYPANKEAETYATEILDCTRYILYYLTSVANEDNLSLVFHVAQRIKSIRDGVSVNSDEQDIFSERLYTLSDLSQAVIRSYADILSTTKGHEKGVNLLQTWPGKLRMPGGIFEAFESHQRDLAHTIAEKDYLKDAPEIREEVEDTVRNYIKSTSSNKTGIKKRKANEPNDDDDDNDDMKDIKKPKKATKLAFRKGSFTKPPSSAPATKKRKSTEKEELHEEQPSRKSSRKSEARVSYADRDSSEDDAEMYEVEQLQASSSATKPKSARNGSVGIANRNSSILVRGEGDDPNLNEMDVDEDDAQDEATPDPEAGEEEEENDTPSPARRSKGPLHPVKANGSTPKASNKPTPAKQTSTTKSSSKKSKSGNEPIQDSKAAMSQIAKKRQSKLTALRGSVLTDKEPSMEEEARPKGKENDDGTITGSGGSRNTNTTATEEVGRRSGLRKR